MNVRQRLDHIAREHKARERARFAFWMWLCVAGFVYSQAGAYMALWFVVPAVFYGWKYIDG